LRRVGLRPLAFAPIDHFGQGRERRRAIRVWRGRGGGLAERGFNLVEQGNVEEELSTGETFRSSGARPVGAHPNFRGAQRAAARRTPVTGPNRIAADKRCYRSVAFGSSPQSEKRISQDDAT
jgi:hypothetical protein